MANYEIEIKSLIGDRGHADELIAKMKSDPSFASRGQSRQLNHYFIGGSLIELCEKVRPAIEPSKASELLNLAESAKDFSVRTRWTDSNPSPLSSPFTKGEEEKGKVIFVIKATVDDTTSSNGTARLEFESEVSLTLETLDKILLEAGFEYQAKWSRERDEYQYKGLNVTVDKNAGYGYLAEFESVIGEADKADETKQNIRQIMQNLGFAELPQDRLARMFDYYNKHWQDYYGTDKIFNIE